MSWVRVTCDQSDEIKRSALHVLSSLTNFVNGEVINPQLPHLTSTVWGHADGTEVLRDECDEDGCRHWMRSETAEGSAS